LGVVCSGNFVPEFNESKAIKVECDTKVEGNEAFDG
jgi:hypothetical protein